MFTPDNFYFVLREKYSDHDSNLFYKSITHGNKCLLNFRPFTTNVEVSDKIVKLGLMYRMQIPTIWLYDQEPFFDSAVDQLRRVFLDNLDPAVHHVIEQASTAQILALFYPNISFPILCTSDKTGTVIDDLKARHFIPCYYWYHAFIARDWYRHYQYFDSLKINNKHNSRYRFMMYCRDTSGQRAYRNTVKNLLEDHKTNIFYDWEEKKHIPSDISASIDSNDAQSADIHLVLETLFDTDKCYLSEKIFKPIVMNQAFIVWGPPGTLSYLREYGFRTFDDAWSEDYDLESDHDRRMSMLVDLVKKISNMDTTEYQDLYQKCLPTIEHNRSWFYNEKFMHYCWKELTDNFTEAFAQRKEIMADFPGGQIFKLINDQPDFLLLPGRKAIIKQYLTGIEQTPRHDILQRYPRLNDL